MVCGGAVIAPKGGKGLTSITIKGPARTQTYAVDAVAVSGGFNPALQLASHFGARPVWSEKIQSFLANEASGDLAPCGRRGRALRARRCALLDGAAAAAAALQSLGVRAATPAIPATRETATDSAPAWWRPGAGDGAKVFVDLQHDVTASDVVLAHREGFRSVEHLKRYTTLGMATDQGRTSSLDALAIMAGLTGRSIPETGVTLARPPVVPLALGAVAGDHRRGAYRPVRETPVHAYALARGAPFVDAGAWKRPQAFPDAVDADLAASVAREVKAVRSRVGVTDISTLGKIEVEGANAAAFLDRVCAMRPSAIRVGRCGYLIMLREDGFLMDDGMLARFAEDRYVAYVSTPHAPGVYRHMQFCRQAALARSSTSISPMSPTFGRSLRSPDRVRPRLCRRSSTLLSQSQRRRSRR